MGQQIWMEAASASVVVVVVAAAAAAEPVSEPVPDSGHADRSAAVGTARRRAEREPCWVHVDVGLDGLAEDCLRQPQVSVASRLTRKWTPCVVVAAAKKKADQAYVQEKRWKPEVVVAVVEMRRAADEDAQEKGQDV